MSALPAEHAVCFAIVTRALAQAREEFRLEKHLRKVSPGRQPRPSFSVDLRSKQISSIPLEAIELIKDEVERLALAHNQLTSLQDGFSGLHRMRYLNLRANLLGEFPAVVWFDKKAKTSFPTASFSLPYYPSFNASMRKERKNTEVTGGLIFEMFALCVAAVDHSPAVA